MLVCLTFDFDGPGPWIDDEHPQDLTALSRGEFGAVAMPRILDLLRRTGVTSTFFVPGHTALLHARLVRTVIEEGHEVGHHGWAHETPTDHEPKVQLEQFDRGQDVLTEVIGSPPVGYRAPAWQLTEPVLERLIDSGFEYDSSCMASDYQPYYLRMGDAWSRETTSTIGQLTDLVELPVYWDLDDAPLFEFVPGTTARSLTTRQIEELWREEYDFAAQQRPDGVFVLTLHPHVIGRGARLAMLGRLADHMSEAGATFTTMGTAASTWRSKYNAESWSEQNVPTQPLANAPHDLEDQTQEWFRLG